MTEVETLTTISEKRTLYFPAMGEEPPAKKRRSNNPREKKYACEYEGCTKRYNRPCLLSEHMRTHTGERPFTCEICGQAFKRNTHLNTHLLSHTTNDEKPFKCEECGKGFNCTQHLNRHVKTHFETFECEHCPVKFKKHTQLRKHVRQSHTTANPFKCETCGKEFKHQKRMEAHIVKLHSKDPNYHCGEVDCGKKFFLWNQLQEHIKEEHKKTPCSICGKRCSGPVGIAQHMKKHERDDLKRNWTCQEDACDFTAQSRDLLVSHYRSHHSYIPDHLKAPVEGVVPSSKSTPAPESPKKLTKSVSMIEKITGAGYLNSGRQIRCPVEGCHYRFVREYDLARHRRAVHERELEVKLNEEIKTGEPVDSGFLVLEDYQIAAALAAADAVTGAEPHQPMIDPVLIHES